LGRKISCWLYWF